MIRHHISQLKGMKTDTEHLKGQGINQPSQNKENAVRLYDAAEWLLEQVWKTIRAFIITVAIQDNTGYVAFNIDGTPDVLGDAKTVFMEEFGLPCDIQIQERDIRIRVEVGTGGTEQ